MKLDENTSGTSCCNARAYMDPLILAEPHTEFAKVPRCGQCHKFVGSPSLYYQSPLKKSWNGNSEALMIERYARTRSPLRFKIVAGILIPENMPHQEGL